MGCAMSFVEPDGDGVTSLPWLPDDDTLRVAAFDVEVKGRRECRTIINQQAIWRALTASVVPDALPYPPDEHVINLWPRSTRK